MENSKAPAVEREIPAYIPLDNLLVSAPHCFLVIFNVVTLIDHKTLKNPMVINDPRVEPKLFLGDGTRTPLLKYQRCLISIVRGRTTGYCYKPTGMFKCFLRWRACCKDPRWFENELSKIRFSPIFYLFFMEDGEETRNFITRVGMNFGGVHKDLNLATTFLFLYSRAGHDEDRRNQGGLYTINQTFSICWSCDKEDEKDGVDENGNSPVRSSRSAKSSFSDFFHDFPCKIPGDCKYLWERPPSFNGTRKDENYFWQFSDPTIDKQLLEKLKSESVEVTTFSRKPRRLVEALALAIFPLRNSSGKMIRLWNHRSELKVSIVKLNAHKSFSELYAFVTDADVFKVGGEETDSLKTFIAPFNSGTWMLVGITIFIFSIVTAGMFNNAFEVKYRLVSNLATVYALTLAAMLDQCQPEIVTLVYRRIGADRVKSMILASAAFSFGILIIMSCYKSVLQAEFIAAKNVYSTKLTDLEILEGIDRYGIINTDSCNAPESTAFHSVLHPYGLIPAPIDVFLNGLEDEMGYLKYFSEITEYRPDKTRCDQLSSATTRKRCWKEKAIASNVSWSMSGLCVEEFMNFVSNTYELDPGILFYVNGKNVVANRSDDNFHSLKSHIGRRKGFVMNQRDFPWYWTKFEDIMEKTELKFAHVNVNPNHGIMSTIDFQFEDAGKSSPEGKDLLERIRILTEGGIFQILVKWGRINFPPIPVKSSRILAANAGEQNDEGPKPMTLRGSSLDILFYLYPIGISCAFLAFLIESGLLLLILMFLRIPTQIYNTRHF